MATLRVYNFDNKQLAETKPLKINLRPGSLAMSTWQFEVRQWRVCTGQAQARRWLRQRS